VPSEEPQDKFWAGHPVRVSRTDTIFFFLLFSGPPRFRFREADSSLSGIIDFAVILQLLVWGIAGIYLLSQLRKASRRTTPLWEFQLTHKAGIVLIALLALGTLTSLSPSLTAVKVFQIAVEFAFCTMFVQRYGVEATLHKIYVSSFLLCLAISVAVFVAPDLVLFATETDSLRLRGSGIAETNVVSAFALILCLCFYHKGALRRSAALSFYGTLLLASLTRAAWLAVALIFVLAAIRKPAISGMKWIYASLWLGIVAVFAGALQYLDRFRNPESVWDLSARIGLWTYLTDNVWQRSKWLGLGYAAGTRVLGLEFNPDLGTGHSIYFDVFVGGGLLGLFTFLFLVVLLAVLAYKCFRDDPSAVSFAVCSLTLFIIIFGTIGAEIDTSPFAFTFWCLLSALPAVRSHLQPQEGSIGRAAPNLQPI
jgi:O-antigen ligase